MAAVSKTVGLSMAQMLTAAAHGNEVYTGIASKETLGALMDFANTIRAIVACSSNNRVYQEKLIDSARLVLQQSVTLVHEARQAFSQPSEASQRLAQIAGSIARSLYECVNCLPGQKDIDEAIKRVGHFASVLSTGQIPSDSIQNPQEVQTELNESALALNQATNQIIIDSRKGSQHLSQSAFNFSDAFADFLQNGVLMSSQEQVNSEERVQIVDSLREVHANANKLLQATKLCLAYPTASHGRQQLVAAVKQVTESINAVVNLCLQTGNPVLMAQKECDNALRQIETTRTIVQANRAETSADQDQLLAIISEPHILSQGKAFSRL